MWGPAPAVNPSQKGHTLEESQSAATKMLAKKKKKMQKLDPGELGFTVQAAPDRVNIGEIETAPFE